MNTEARPVDAVEKNSPRGFWALDFQLRFLLNANKGLVSLLAHFVSLLVFELAS